jgi:hypothetical protein
MRHLSAQIQLRRRIGSAFSWCPAWGVVRAENTLTHSTRFRVIERCVEKGGSPHARDRCTHHYRQGQSHPSTLPLYPQVARYHGARGSDEASSLHLPPAPITATWAYPGGRKANHSIVKQTFASDAFTHHTHALLVVRAQAIRGVVCAPNPGALRLPVSGE